MKQLWYQFDLIVLTALFWIIFKYLHKAVWIYLICILVSWIISKVPSKYARQIVE